MNVCRGCRPPSRIERKQGGKRAVAPWFCLLVLKDTPAVSYIRGRPVAALSTWKTHQQMLSNPSARVKQEKLRLLGFDCFFFPLPGEGLLYNVKSMLPHSTWSLCNTKLLDLLPCWWWAAIYCRGSICLLSYLHRNWISKLPPSAKVLAFITERQQQEEGQGQVKQINMINSEQMMTHLSSVWTAWY